MTASNPNVMQTNPSLILADGTIGYAVTGDLLDGSGYDTYLKTRGSNNIIHFMMGTNEVGNISSGGLGITTGNVSAPSVIKVGVALGIKNNAGVKLAEVTSSGNLIISGTQFGTTGSSPSLVGGQSFDSFDVAEVYPCDQAYESGTVLCVGDNDQLTKCSHVGCHCAMVVSSNPGLLLGATNEENFIIPLAMAGRVNVNCSTAITRRSLVCSDGQGGVRAMNSGETGFALGFAVNDAVNGQVGIVLSKMFCTAP